MLDNFAGAEHLATREGYERSHREIQSLERELAELREREGARERDLDLLRFELAEIDAAELDPGELQELGAERDRLRHAGRLRDAAGAALAAIANPDGEGADAAAAVSGAGGALGAAAGVDGALDALGERVAALSLELDDVAAELRSYLDGLDADPARLEAIEERLAEADRLERKHGGTLEGVLEHAERCRAEIERLANAEELAAGLEARIEPAKGERSALAAKLTAGRKRAAKELAKEVQSTLAELAMEGASLEVRLDPHPDGLGATGAERVELLLATNPGMPLAPLRDAASGGELSRVMLALGGLGSAGERATVFDEIDAGVGGTTARAVGERLRALGQRGQVICITHLPQVASMAEAHFRIDKRIEAGATVAAVERVEGEGLVAEICRMLGADAGDQAAARHARELLAA